MGPKTLAVLRGVHDRTRQEVIILKSPIWLKLGRKIDFHQHIHVLKYQVKIFHFTRVAGKP